MYVNVQTEPEIRLSDPVELFEVGQDSGIDPGDFYAPVNWDILSDDQHFIMVRPVDLELWAAPNHININTRFMNELLAQFPGD